MSTTVDSRVVEMQFDNKHFESNVATSMSTLDKLKQKLNLSGASKGLEDVSSAAKKVDLSGISNSAETVGLKFNAMYTIADQALRNITNSAMAAGQKIISALTIDPVKSGFNEYEMKMDSVKTIMASTGESVEKVNEYLEELNEYSDKTIYSFSDMTTNIGKFTNAGVKLEDAVLAIQGISNEAAVSGANANEASRAMYNFAQALSSGYVKLIDWKSIENANMATVEFKQQLIDTAVELGTVTKSADGMYKTIEGHDFSATKSFNDVLQDQWMTSEVLIETLKDYADETTNIGKKAFAAAQEVTKFTQMWDVLKETAQSGWAKTWELIIGDINQAKAIFTPLTDFFSGIIDKISDVRNGILESALGRGFTSLKDKINKVMNPMTDALETAKGAVSGVTRTIEEHAAVVNSVIRGEWGRTWKRWNALTEAGYDWVYVQNMVNEKLGNSKRNTSEYTKWLENQNNATEKTTETSGDLIMKIAMLSEEEAKALGYTDEQIAAFRELAKAADKLGLPLDEFIDNMDKINGRWLLINSFKNIGKGLIDTFQAIKKAWQDVFPPKSIEERGEGLFNMIASFHKFTSKFTKMVNKETGETNETFDNLVRTLKGVFAILDLITSFVGGTFKFVWKAASALLSYFDLDILEVTAAIGDAIVKFRDWIKSVTDFEKIFDKIIPPITNAINAVRDWIDSLKESENLPRDIAKGLVKGFDAAVKFIKKMFSNLGSSVSDGVKGVGEGSGIISKIAGGLWKGIKIVGQVFVELGKIIFDRLRGTLSKLGQTVLDGVNKVLGKLGFKEISLDMIAGLIEGLKGGIGKVLKTLGDFASRIISKVCEVLGIHSPSTVFIAIGGFIIAGLISGLTNTFPQVGEFFKTMGSKIAGFASNIDFGKIFAGLLSIGVVVAIINLAKLLNSISKPLDGIGDILENTAEVVKSTNKVVKNFAGVLGAVKWRIYADALKTVAVALAILAASIIALTFFEPAKLWNAVGVLAALAVVIGALVFVMGKFGGKDAGGSAKMGLSILAIGLAMLFLAYALKVVSKLDPVSTIAILTGIMVLFAAIGKISETSDGDAIKSFASILMKLAGAILILVIIGKIIAGMSWEQMAKAGVGILALTLVLIGVIAAMTAIKKKLGPQTKIDSIGSALIKIAGAILILVIVGKLIAGMSWEQMAKAGAGILVLSLVMVGIVAALLLISKKTGRSSKAISDVGKTMAGIAAAMLILVLTAKLIATMSWGDMAKAGVGLAGLAAIIVGIVACLKPLGKNKSLKGVGPTLLMISIAIAILALIAIILGHIDIAVLAKGIVAVGLLAGIMALLIVATSKAKDCKSNLIIMTVAIGLLAVAIIALSFINPVDLYNAVGAMAILMALFALIIKVGKNAKGSIAPLIVLTAALVVMAGVLVAMSALDTKDAIKNASALAIMMLSMSVVMKMMNKMKKVKTSVLVSMGILAGVMVLLGLVLAMMTALNVSNAITNAVALSILMGVLTIVAVALGLIGNKATNILMGSLGLAALVGVMALVGLVLAMMTALNVQNGLENARVLAELMLALTLVSAAMAIIGMGAVNILLGAVGMAALVGVMALVVLVLDMMSSIDTQTAMANTTMLTTLFTAIGNICVKLALVAPLAVIGVAAMTALTALIVAVGLIAVAIGALVEKFPVIETFVSTGIELMVLLADGIGRMIGAFIAGFTETVAASLPVLGQCLSDFMTNATVFIEGSKTVDEKVLAGVGILAAAILALTVADLLEGISSLLQGGSSLADLGTELSQFMANASPFIVGASMVSSDMMSGVKAIAESILTLTGSGLLNTLTSYLPGSKELSDFAEDFPLLGDGLVGFANALKNGGFTEADLPMVSAAAESVKTLAQASKAIPNTGGLLGDLLGDNDLGDFAEQFPVLGTGIANFLQALKDGNFSEADVNIVESAAETVKTLASAASEIPNSGGVWGKLVGNNDLGDFAEQFPVLGTGIIGFLNALKAGGFSDADINMVESAAETVKTLASAASEIPNSGGVWGKLVGENNLDTFASQFPNLGTGIVQFLSNLEAGGYSSDKTGLVDNAVATLGHIIEFANQIPNSGGWWSKIKGDNDLGDFADNFPELGEGLAEFASYVGGFGESTITSINCAVGVMKAIADIPEDFDSDYLATFGENLFYFGSDVYSAFSYFGDITKEMCQMVNIASTSLSNMSKAADKYIKTFTGANVLAANANVKNLVDVIKSMATVKEMDADGFATSMSKLGTANVDAFVLAVSNGAKKMIEAGKTAINRFISGIQEKHSAVESACKKVANKGADAIGTRNALFTDAGEDLGDGLIEGINNKKTAVYNAAYALGQMAVQGEKDGQQSNSPSKLTMLAGNWLGEGLIIGMQEMGRKVYAAGSNLGSTATDTISSAVSAVSDMINSDVDTQPTIRPVLDLTDVKSGVSRIGGMFGGQTLAVDTATIGAVSAMMSQHGQNGANSDVVSAIDKLRGDLGNSRGDTYQINGVTYDDGSNITEAVKTIVRAARIERRV